MTFTDFTHRTLGGLLMAGSLVLVACGDPVASSPLVTGERGITSIAADEFFLYYAKIDGSVMRVSLDGGKPEVVVSGQNAPDHLAVDATHVFWSNQSGEIARSAKQGGAAEILAQAGHQSGLALDADHLYFTTSEGTVQKRSKQDGAVTDLAMDQKVRSQFAVSGSSLVFNAGLQDTSSVREMLTDSGAVDVLVSAQSPSDLVAISSSNIYWASTGDPSVSVAQRDGSNPRQIATIDRVLPTALLGDDAFVYFADASGAVNVAAIQGGEAQQIAKGPAGKVSITLDQASIYWANSEDGVILSMPRQ
jgi:hypothetical protein